eukprot:3094701-Rhodomonas_salina.1
MHSALGFVCGGKEGKKEKRKKRKKEKKRKEKDRVEGGVVDAESLVGAAGSEGSVALEPERVRYLLALHHVQPLPPLHVPAVP